MNSKQVGALDRRAFIGSLGAALGLVLAPGLLQAQSSASGAKKRLLIAYASKTGSTAEVAARIGQVLACPRLAIDVLDVEKVSDVAAYQAVIIGSAIRAGHWVRSATKFVEHHQAELNRVPVAHFTCCMTLHQDTEENRQKVAAYTVRERRLVNPVAVGLFAGKMDFNLLPFFDRSLVKLMKVPEGDFRNWSQIETWSRTADKSLGFA